MFVTLETIPGIKVLEHNSAKLRKFGPDWATWLMGFVSVALIVALFTIPYSTLNLGGLLFLLLITMASIVTWMFLMPVRLPEEYRIMRTNECNDYNWSRIVAYYDVEPVSNNVYTLQPKFERDIWRNL